ncbi:hypothetical protein RUND412_004150 [Rhizina undulata]
MSSGIGAMTAEARNKAEEMEKEEAFEGLTLRELPKSKNFTEKLPPDPLFPTPESSAAVPRVKLGPRMVKKALYTYVRPEPTESPPELLAVSPAAFKTLGLKPSEATTPEFVSLVSGNGGFENEVYPWAQCYGGWQFGQWAGQLGDGRAISLFEVTNPATGKWYELQLKGAGKTPYSRFADGRAVLRSSIREFIVSEYLNAIGIPTTRALSLTLLPGTNAVRERIEPCAIVARFAESWIRLGTFDIFRWRGDRENIRRLADYVREEVLGMGKFNPEEKADGVEKEGVENRYAEMYREVVRRNAKTVAMWQVYGFMNGVLNTDNTSILGLSLDFGPFAFMDNFDPAYTPNHDDHLLRYSYKNQATIIWWNLVRFAEDIAELFGAGSKVDDPSFIANGVSEADEKDIIKTAEAVIESAGEEYKATFLAEYQRLMAARLGLRSLRDTDQNELFSTCLEMMEKIELDFHHFFRRLSEMEVRRIMETGSEEERLEAAGEFLQKDGAFGGHKEAKAKGFVLDWLKVYAERLKSEDVTDQERIPKMKRLNPKFVPKNWVLEELIFKVEKEKDRDILDKVLHMVLNPFEDEWGWNRGEEERLCGDVPRQSRASQCSCSS